MISVLPPPDHLYSTYSEQGSNTLESLSWDENLTLVAEVMKRFYLFEGIIDCLSHAHIIFSWHQINFLVQKRFWLLVLGF